MNIDINASFVWLESLLLAHKFFVFHFIFRKWYWYWYTLFQRKDWLRRSKRKTRLIIWMEWSMYKLSICMEALNYTSFWMIKPKDDWKYFHFSHCDGQWVLLSCKFFQNWSNPVCRISAKWIKMLRMHYY